MKALCHNLRCVEDIQIKALVIVGPTAIGKTALSLELAEKFFEIISADSVQVYRYLDIGSGKPELHERERIPHHLIDIVDPDYPFTAGEFVRRAGLVATEILSRGLFPLFVGGTGLYIKSFFEGISDIPEVDPSVRTVIMEELEIAGAGVLHKELMEADPVFAEKVHPNDKQRIVRGLEIFRGTGYPLSSFFHKKRGAGSKDTLFIGLVDEKEKIKENISCRVDQMIQKGLIDEVIALREMGYGSDLKSMKTIGYSEINQYIDKKITLEKAALNIKQNTAAYAKRQITWFKKNPEVVWFNPVEMHKIKETVKRWLQ